MQIHQNANRAAALIGQLLAFSRKQNLQVKLLNIREIISDLAHVLHRLVGEKVNLLLYHGTKLPMVGGQAAIGIGVNEPCGECARCNGRGG